jgi:hypothetical protein
MLVCVNLRAQLPKVLQDDITESYNWILSVAKSTTCNTAKPMTEKDLVESKLETCKFIDTFKMFPNPAEDIITVVFTGVKRPTQILINGLDGKNYFIQREDEFDGFFNQSIVLDKIPAGLYLFSIVQGKEVFNKKLIIQ